MDRTEVYQRNVLLFNSGIEADVDKSPHNMTYDELNLLENRLHQLLEETGNQYSFVEWGQPFGGPISGRKYHPKTKIDQLLSAYEIHELRGIHPKAGFVVDLKWISEQRDRLKKYEKQEQQGFDWHKYWEFAQTTQF